MPRRRAHHVLVAVLVVLASCMAPGAAVAHQLQVLDPGPGGLDAGQAVPARLIHATLDGAGDSLRVAVTPGDVPLAATLLVPARPPERDLDGADLPALESTWELPVTSVDGAATTDEMTGIEYVPVAAIDLAAATGEGELVVERGGAPVRVALLVGSPDLEFAAVDADQTPRAAVDTRLWAETPPAGSPQERSRVRATPDRRYALYGAGLALTGVLVAVWWIRSGRDRSRRSGLERAARERGDASPSVDPDA